MQKKLRTEDVFKTEGYPDHTFIQPPGFTNIVVDIRSPHKPVVFEGASGTGKTSAILGAIEKAGIERSKVQILSARSPDDIKTLQRITDNSKLEKDVTIVDDFHRLPDSIQKPLSDMLRLMAEDPGKINGKLIVAGINEVGRKLISVSDDLLKRMSVYRIKSANKDEAINVLGGGATKLGFTISNIDEIFDESRGDYWTLQKLCQQAALDKGIDQTTDNPQTITANVKTLRSSIVEHLSTQFGPLLREFVRGVRFRKTNQAYLHFMKAFSEQKVSNLSLEELAIRAPSEKARLDQIKTNRLTKLLQRDLLKEKFFYDSDTTNFSIEDPALAYFIQNIDWKRVAIEAGFPGSLDNFDFEVGISFAGEQRDLAKLIADQLSEDDILVFYDEYQEFLGKNLEKLLKEKYGEKCRYVVVLISTEYKDKTWTSFERAVWSSRVEKEAVLPIFIDDVIIKEVSTSICRIDFRQWKEYRDKKINHEIWTQHFDVLIRRIRSALDR